MPKIFIPLILALILPQVATATTYSLDDGTNGKAETYTYENFIGNVKLTVDAKPDDLWIIPDVDVTKNAGEGLGVSTSYWGVTDNSRALEKDEALVFTFSEQVLLTGFTIKPGNQHANYFGVSYGEEDTNVDFKIDSEAGFVSFTQGEISLLSFAITGLVNCTGLFIQSLETASTVPLPAALPLYAAGMGVLGFLGWRKRRKVQA